MLLEDGRPCRQSRWARGFSDRGAVAGEHVLFNARNEIPKLCDGATANLLVQFLDGAEPLTKTRNLAHHIHSVRLLAFNRNLYQLRRQ